MSQHFCRSFIFLSALLFCTPLWAENFEVPRLSAPVIDQAQMISRTARSKISQVLQQLKQQGKIQITVLTVKDLAGLSIEQASIKVADQWKLGDEKTDNGILLLISKKERKMRIEVGQGLEGNLTDAYSKRIIDETMVPLFRSGKVDEGILLGIYQIAGRANPDLNLQSIFGAKQGWSRKGRSRRGMGSFLPLLFFFFLFISRLGGRRRGRSSGAGMLMTGMLLGGLSGRGGGGFGGGGFGGGGGGFSGGGASGGW